LPFTDIHSHILPGYDDGAENDEEFFQMARAAVGGGTARMAATPHYDLENPSLLPESLPAEVRRRTGLLQAKGIPLELVPGVEVRANAGLYQLAREDGGLEQLILGGTGKYILTDLPLIDVPTATPEILFQMQLGGYVPILAHPERNRYLSEHPEVVREMVERGVEIQVNSGSLEGIYGKTAQRIALALLREGAARLVASDAHSPSGRSTDLSGAASIIRAQLGDDAARILLEVNPERALAGEALLDVDKRTIQPAGRTGLFRRRRRP
jgi:protein-tyrosine phosphatase